MLFTTSNIIRVKVLTQGEETFFFFVHFPMRQQTRLVGKNKVLFRAAIEI